MEAPWLPSSVRSRFIAVVRTFVCLVVVLLATALPSPTAAQFEDLRKLYDEINPPPNHPPFADPISANSPNAAGRYLWLARQVDERAFDAAGYVERSLTEWKLPDYLMDDDVPVCGSCYFIALTEGGGASHLLAPNGFLGRRRELWEVSPGHGTGGRASRRAVTRWAFVRLGGSLVLPIAS